MKPSEFKIHNQPEKFPFFNSKYFELSLENIKNKKKEQINFYVFSFDDDFIVNLHMFMKQYDEFIDKPKKIQDFLNKKLSSHKFNEDSDDFESLNFRKHLENYKLKMRLIINKMN